MALSEYAGKVLYFILLSLVFAGIYMALGHENFNGLDESSNFFDYWYFSFTTFSTVGYGDISPKSSVAKAVVITQQMILLLDLADEFLGLGTSIYNKLTGKKPLVGKTNNDIIENIKNSLKELENKTSSNTIPKRSQILGSVTRNNPVRSSPMRKQVKYDSLINDIKESRPIDALNVTA